MTNLSTVDTIIISFEILNIIYNILKTIGFDNKIWEVNIFFNKYVDIGF